jgi:anti-sigma28 factor (negative regulator of flagellin synthesis)
MDIKAVSSAYQAYETAPVNAKKEAKAKSPTAGKERVELSDSSVNLQKVKEAIDKAPEIRIPIVEEIKERIKNNDYPIETSADNALDKMLKYGIL